VIAGALAAGGRDVQPAVALGADAESRDHGPLRLAWRAPARAHEADGVTVVLDGFLLGEAADLGRVGRAWRESPSGLTDLLRGAFTLVVWDSAAEAGVIVCDHFSLRNCLIHGARGGPLRFATHPPALRRMVPRAPEPDPGVIAPWIAPQYLQGHRTMAAGVERLGGARLVELGAQGWRRRRYWRPEWRGTIDADRDESVDMLRSELRRSLAERLGEDETVGTVLSGGVDSSVVLATAAGLEPRRDLRAYSAVFPDWPLADESERIAATTDALGVPGVSFALRPQGAFRLALQQLRDTGTVPGGPGGIVERPGIERAAADGVSVLLDGQGGDEVFGRSPYLMADRLRHANVRGLARLVRLTLPPLPRRRDKLAAALRISRDFALTPALPRAFRGLPGLRGAQPLAAPDWLRPESARTVEEVHAPFPWLTDERVPRWWAYHSYLLSDHVEGSGLGEHIWERGAPFGIRSAAPLFDVGLVELVLRLPPEAHWDRTDRPLARATVAGVLPDLVRLNRRKANIGPFYLDLMTGPDSAIMRELLLDPAARIRQYANPAWLDRNVPRAPTRSEPDWLVWATVVWRLATAECWLRWAEDEGFPETLLERDDLPHPAAVAD